MYPGGESKIYHNYGIRLNINEREKSGQKISYTIVKVLT
jgi:hypothetical protein